MKLEKELIEKIKKEYEEKLKLLGQKYTLRKEIMEEICKEYNLKFNTVDYIIRREKMLASAKRYFTANKEKVRQRRSSPEFKKHLSEYYKEYYKKNRDKYIHQYVAKYRKAHPEKVKAVVHRFYEKYKKILAELRSNYDIEELIALYSQGKIDELKQKIGGGEEKIRAIKWLIKRRETLKKQSQKESEIYKSLKQDPNFEKYLDMLVNGQIEELRKILNDKQIQVLQRRLPMSKVKKILEKLKEE